MRAHRRWWCDCVRNCGLVVQYICFYSRFMEWTQKAEEMTEKKKTNPKMNWIQIWNNAIRITPGSMAIYFAQRVLTWIPIMKSYRVDMDCMETLHRRRKRANGSARRRDGKGSCRPFLARRRQRLVLYYFSASIGKLGERARYAIILRTCDLNETNEPTNRTLPLLYIDKRTTLCLYSGRNAFSVWRDTKLRSIYNIWLTSKREIERLWYYRSFF